MFNLLLCFPAIFSLNLLPKFFLNQPLNLSLRHLTQYKWCYHVFLIHYWHCILEYLTPIKSAPMQSFSNKHEPIELRVCQALCHTQLRHTFFRSFTLKQNIRIVKHNVEEEVDAPEIGFLLLVMQILWVKVLQVV